MYLEGSGRFAVNRLITEDDVIINAVIELENGVVTSYYHLSEELPFTVWVGGTFELQAENGASVARKVASPKNTDLR